MTNTRDKHNKLQSDGTCDVMLIYLLVLRLDLFFLSMQDFGIRSKTETDKQILELVANYLVSYKSRFYDFVVDT